MIEFDYAAEAELFLTRSKRSGNLARYRRFARAADAIRFAIEELPRELLLGTHLQVGEGRYGGEGIRRLYHGAGYPLPRVAAGGGEGCKPLVLGEPAHPKRRVPAPRRK